MASLSSRIAALAARADANRESIASGEPAAKRRRLKQKLKQRAQEAKNAELKPEPETDEAQVLRWISPILDWKIRGKRVVKILPRGVLNRSALLEVKGDGNFVVRKTENYAVDIRDAWGTSLEREFAFGSFIGQQGLAPKCVHFLADDGVIVSRYMDQYTQWDSTQARENYRLCVGLLKQLHSLPIGTLSAKQHQFLPFDPFQTCASYRKQLLGAGVLLPPILEDAYRVLDEWKRLLLSQPPPPECVFVICHNELRGNNILHQRVKDEDMLRLISFDRAALGDRYYDMANFSRLNDFEEEEDVLLLKLYFDTFEDKKMVRFQLMKTIADLVEGMQWLVAELYIPVGDLDKDSRWPLAAVNHPEWTQHAQPPPTPTESSPPELASTSSSSREIPSHAEALASGSPPEPEPVAEPTPTPPTPEPPVDPAARAAACPASESAHDPTVETPQDPQTAGSIPEPADKNTSTDDPSVKSPPPPQPDEEDTPSPDPAAEVVPPPDAPRPSDPFVGIGSRLPVALRQRAVRCLKSFVANTMSEEYRGYIREGL